MPKKNSLTARRVLALFLTYITLCVAGGVAASIMFVPGVMSVNSVVKTVVPSLRVDGIDFDVTALPQKSRLYASDGKTIIATFYAQNRTVVPLRRISQYMQQAMVAREDRRFFEHSGVDVQGVMRAFVKTFVKKSDMQGGSSLTQQYVKNVLMIKARENNDPLAEYHASEGTIARKLREMLIAIQMEKKYSKLEILQGYLNIAQFGSNNIYGVETAAHRYFNTSAAKLNLVQAATIAAITKNPSHYDPSIEENQPEAQKQRNIVLDLMLRQGFINKKEHDTAVATPLKNTLNVQREVSKIGCQAAGDAAFFCDYVTKRILHSREFGKTAVAREKLLTEGGLDIYTTMDLRASKAAMKAARDTIPVNDKSGFEVSIAAIKPGTGEVLAFGSNRIYDASDAARSDPTHTALNYAVDERDGGGLGWQIGSTWKPINMVAWMLAGKSINQPLRTTIRYNNSDFNCNKFRGVGSWFVQNSGGGTVSPETPLQGLVRSHNTTQASMAQQIKLCSIADAYYMTTAGFVPYQVASFVAVGNAESQKSFNGMTINGRTMAAWYGMYIATPAWKQFMNDYLKAANIPVDNDYGKPDPKYTAGASSTHDSLYKKPAQTEQEKRDEDARRQAAREQQEEANNQQQTQDQYGTARRDDYNTSTGDAY